MHRISPPYDKPQIQPLDMFDGVLKGNKNVQYMNLTENKVKVFFKKKKKVAWCLSANC